jgi:hypothetical protein
MKTRLPLELPDGNLLIAVVEDDTEYPRLSIYRNRLNKPDELLCFAEFNPDMPKGQELCIGAYREAEEETVFYKSYNNQL